MLWLRAGGRGNVIACLAGALILACLGTTGCAADDEVDPTASVTLNAELAEGTSKDALWVVGDSPKIDLYWRECDPTFEIEKWSGDEWSPLQDDRPAADAGSGYYLDGAFTPAMPSTVCADRSCVHHPGFQPRRSPALSFNMIGAREYVQVGTKKALGGPATNVAGAGAGEAAPEVPEIESRLLSGQVQITYFYYTDANCESPKLEVSAEVTFPGP